MTKVRSKLENLVFCPTVVSTEEELRALIVETLGPVEIMNMFVSYDDEPPSADSGLDAPFDAYYEDHKTIGDKIRVGYMGVNELTIGGRKARHACFNYRRKASAQASEQGTACLSV